MLFKVLAVGDVTGESGVDFLHRRLRSLKKEKSIDFVVANGENAAGNGLLPTHAEDILAAGVDVITLGNHSFGKTQIADFWRKVLTFFALPILRAGPGRVGRCMIAAGCRWV